MNIKLRLLISSMYEATVLILSVAKYPLSLQNKIFDGKEVTGLCLSKVFECTWSMKEMKGYRD